MVKGFSIVDLLAALLKAKNVEDRYLFIFYLGVKKEIVSKICLIVLCYECRLRWSYIYLIGFHDK